MEIPDKMISDAIKKLAGYKYYMAKKVEIKKAKIVDEPKEQHVSPVKSGRGKGFMCYGDQAVNAPNKLKKDVVPRKTRSQTIVEETVVGPIIDDPAVQSLLNLQKGSKASRLESLKQKKQAVAGEGSSAAHKKYYDASDNDSKATLYSLSSDKIEEGANETNEADDSNMDLSDDNSQGDDNVASSSLNFIRTLLDETPANELPDFMSHPVYTDAQTTSVVHNPEENPELTTYISGASEVPLGTHIDVLATKPLLQEMFPDEEYDQKLEALKNFNVSKAFEKAIQASLLTKIKKLLPTHIMKAVESYVKPRLNNFVLEVMKNNQINLFTQSSTSTDDLLEMDLKLKLLNRIHESQLNMTHLTNQKLYDTLYESVCLDYDALKSQDAEPSFHKRSHDNQDSLNNHEGENKKKRRKDVDEPSSRSSRRNKSPVIHAQVDTPAMQPLEQEDEYVRKHPYS
ncbi:hypothetical protein Tco_0587555 [Tanacetum coccineum]